MPTSTAMISQRCLVHFATQQKWNGEQREAEIDHAADAGALAALGILIAHHDDARQLARPSQTRHRRQRGDDQQKPGVDAEGVVQGQQLSAISNRSTQQSGKANIRAVSLGLCTRFGMTSHAKPGLQSC